MNSCLSLFLLVIVFLASSQASRVNLRVLQGKDCKGEAGLLDPDCKLQNAPVIYVKNKADELMNINPSKDFTIRVSIQSQSDITVFDWKLDPKFHNEEESKAFLALVKQDELMHDLILPANSKFEKKEYHLIAYAKNADLFDHEEYVTIRFAESEFSLSLEITPDNGEGLTTRFKFIMKKSRPAKVQYTLFYLFGNSQRSITIASGVSEEEQEIPEAEHIFPMPKGESEIASILLTYRTDKQEFGDTRKAITILGAVDASLATFEDIVNKWIQNTETLDIVRLSALSNSIMRVFFKEEHYHTHSHTSVCNDAYCSDHGSCALIEAPTWKKCTCKTNYEGPTCAFEIGKETQVVDLYKKVIQLTKKIPKTTSSIGKIAEVIKSVSSVRHIFDFSLIEEILETIPNVIENLGDNVNEFTVIEDLFVSVENIKVALTQHYLDKKEGEPDRYMNLIVKARQDLDEIFRAQFIGIPVHNAISRLSMESCGFSLVVFEPSKMAQFEKVVVERSTYIDQKVETALIRVPRALFAAKEGQEVPDKVGFQAYLTQYNPYEVVSITRHKVVSDVLNLELRATNRWNVFTPAVLGEGDKISVSFPVPKTVLDLREVDCAAWNSELESFEKKNCVTQMFQKNMITCECKNITSYALITQREDAPPVPDRRRPKRQPVSYDFKAEHILFTGFVFGFFLLFSFFISRTSNEDVPNGSFQPSLTVHPVYSLLKVNKANLTRQIRLHLFFATFLSQICIASFVIKIDSLSDVERVLLTIFISVLENYFYGAVARCVAAGEQKVRGRQIILILIKIFLFADCIITIFQTATDAINPPSELLKLSFTAFFVDLLVFDVITIFLCKVEFFLNIVRFRGFYTEGEIPHSTFA